MSLTQIACLALGLLCLVPVARADEPARPIPAEVKQRPEPVRIDRSELRAELRSAAQVARTEQRPERPMPDRPIRPDRRELRAQAEQRQQQREERQRALRELRRETREERREAIRSLIRRSQ